MAASSVTAVAVPRDIRSIFFAPQLLDFDISQQALLQNAASIDTRFHLNSILHSLDDFYQVSAPACVPSTQPLLNADTTWQNPYAAAAAAASSQPYFPPPSDEIPPYLPAQIPITPLPPQVPTSTNYTTNPFGNEADPTTNASAATVPAFTPDFAPSQSSTSSKPKQSSSASSPSTSTQVSITASTDAHRIEKRRANTLAARRYRQNRAERLASLEAVLKAVEVERDALKGEVERLRGETQTLRDLLVSRR